MLGLLYGKREAVGNFLREAPTWVAVRLEEMAPSLMPDAFVCQDSQSELWECRDELEV